MMGESERERDLQIKFPLSVMFSEEDFMTKKNSVVICPLIVCGSCHGNCFLLLSPPFVYLVFEIHHNFCLRCLL